MYVIFEFVKSFYSTILMDSNPVGVSSADSNGTIYVADTNNNLIRKISSLNLGCSILVNKNIKTEGRGLAM